MSAINEVEDDQKEKNEPLQGEPEGVNEISLTKIKLYYAATVGGVLLVVILVAIIVIFLGGNENGTNIENKNNTKNDTYPGPDPDYDPLIYKNLTNYFSAKYDVVEENQEILLFNEKYLDSIKLMLIDDRRANITNKYNFTGIREHTITIEFKKNLESTEDMFKGCTNLRGIFFTKFKTENIENMAGMFSGCTSLTSLNLTTFENSKVTDMSNLFYDCSLLSNIVFNNFDTSNVVDMSNLFYGCIAITSLNLEKFNTKNVKKIKNIFNKCINLENLKVGDNFII